MSRPHHDPAAERLRQATRRHFLGAGVAGVGGLYLAARAAADDSNLAQGHGLAPQPGGGLPAKVKRVIFLHMIGAPSQLDLFDYRPKLAEHDGKDCPQEYLEGNRFAFIQGVPKLLGPQFPFARHGEGGQWFSDRVPRLAAIADDLCFVKTMQTDQFNHGPAQLMVHTGNARTGYPSLGSWATWGLGSLADDLPGYMVLLSGGRQPRVGKALWGSGFLPSTYQGVQCRSQGEPVLNVANPEGVGRGQRRKVLDVLETLNRQAHADFGDPETLTRIEQYEMAFRMQTAVPEVMDIAGEPADVLAEYGAEPGKTSFANNCVLARRLAERGVRFVQLFDWGWDSHGEGEATALNGGFSGKVRQMDQAAAALVTDLKRRGMLDDTLVVWGGEFGRTPMRENRGGREMKFVGRDHSPGAFTFWLAGAGVKAGTTYGRTDDFGYRAAENPVHLRDFHATLLRLLGLDHHRLIFPFQGLDQKLTGVVPAAVVEGILS